MSRIFCIALTAALFVGCSQPQAGEPATESITATTFNTAGAPTVEFSVPDMMCPEGCGEKTKEILAEQAGAKEVLIDFDAKTATVAIEEGKFDADVALAALVDHGFDHSALKRDVEAPTQPQEESTLQ